MNETPDWLARTGEIKRRLAKRYGDRPASDQLRGMQEEVEKEEPEPEAPEEPEE